MRQGAAADRRADRAAETRRARLRGAGRSAPLPRWVLAPPPPEPSPPKPLLPSRPSGPEPATLSPLATRGRDRFKRGLIVHRLLQSLPELPAAERAAAARRFLALPVHGLDGEEQAEICGEVLAVLDDPRLSRIVGAEFPRRSADRRADRGVEPGEPNRRCPARSTGWW